MTTIAEVKAALEQAVDQQSSMRIGYEVAEVLLEALRAAEADADRRDHDHRWEALGFDLSGNVAMTCACGAAIAVQPEVQP